MNFKYPFQPLNILRFCAGRPKAVTNAIRGQRRLEGRRLRADGHPSHHRPCPPAAAEPGPGGRRVTAAACAGRGGAPERGWAVSGWAGLARGWASPPRSGSAGGAGMPGREAEVRPCRSTAPGPPRWLCRGEPGGSAPVGGEGGSLRPLSPLRGCVLFRGLGAAGDGRDGSGPVRVGPGGPRGSHCWLGVCPTLLLIRPCFLICRDSAAPRGAETRSPLANTVICL